MTIKIKQKAEWDVVAKDWDKAVGESGVWHQQHDIDPVIFRMLGNIKGKVILEIGCGNGYFARMLAKKRANVTAVDISSKLIKLAVEKEKENRLGITYLVRDAASLEGLKDESFDVAIANMSLMDIADAEQAIKEVSRTLKPEGLFVFSITHPTFGNIYWSIMTEKKEQRFGKFVYRYLQSYAEKDELSIAGVMTNLTIHHRSIETYIRYLRDAGLRMDQFYEIATKKLITKATEEDGDVSRRRSRYRTLAEKKMKEMAGKEIPMFLIVSAMKK